MSKDDQSAAEIQGEIDHLRINKLALEAKIARLETLVRAASFISHEQGFAGLPEKYQPSSAAPSNDDGTQPARAQVPA